MPDARMNSSVLRIAGLRKRFREVEAVRGLDLEVYRGEIFGLIGPDGAGKTTTMRVACGLLKVDAGDVSVAGFDALRETRKIKPYLGYMPQRFSLYPDLSVSENLRFFADLYRVPPGVRRAREERLMEFSRLGEFRRRRAGQLSGGMKQKLALSCTLIHTPDLLVLDEPTTGVDPVSRQEFWSILRELANEGKGLLVSTPYLDEATLCARIALMHRGRVIAQGTPDEVIRRFNRRLVEITGDLRAIWQVLASAPLPGVTVSRYGDRVHALFDTGEQEQQLRARLATQRAEMRTIPPGIEDAYVLLMEREGAQA